MSLPPTGSPAMDRALAQIGALFDKPRAERMAAHQARWNAGVRPQTDAWGFPIIDDPDRERTIAERERTVDRWAEQAERRRIEDHVKATLSCPASTVLAARVEIRRLA